MNSYRNIISLFNKAFNIGRLIIVLISVSVCVNAQEIKNFPEKFISNPNIASLGSFSSDNYVDLYTGKINLNIPIYTVPNGSNPLSIFLKYNTEGVKVEDISSEVGLGWSLIAGGFLTREIRGVPDNFWCGRFSDRQGSYLDDNLTLDDYINGIRSGTLDCNGILDDPSLHSYKYCEWTILDILQYEEHHTYSGPMCSAYGGGYDTEPDIFHFSFGKINGSFFLDGNGEPQILEGEQDIDIIPAIGPMGNGTDWIFTTSDGTKYHFLNTPDYYEVSWQKYTKNWSATPNGWGTTLNLTIPGEDFTKEDLNALPAHLIANEGTVTTWYLSKIESVYNEKDDIDFVYEVTNDIEVFNITQKRFDYVKTVVNTHYNYWDNGSWDFNEHSPKVGTVNWSDPPTYASDINLFAAENEVYNDPRLFTISSPKLISEIIFNQGKIVFERSEVERRDLPGHYPLSNILIYDYEETLVKKFDFVQGYFTSSDCNGIFCKRLKLEAFGDVGLGTKATGNFYSFEYNESTNLPHRYSTKQDYWGFYNANSTVHKIPPGYRHGLEFSGADRSFDSGRAQANILKKIVYPTGGYSEFFYEQNTYRNNELNFDFPWAGLRVAKIVDSSGNGPDIETVYSYTNESGHSSGGIVNFLEDPRFYFQKDLMYLDINHSGGDEIAYLYHYILRSSKALNDFIKTNGGYVGYQQVQIEKVGSGKKVVNFTSPSTHPDVEVNKILSPFGDVISRNLPFEHPHESYDWQRGKKTAEKYFTSTGKPVKTITYEYEFSPTNFTPQTTYGMRFSPSYTELSLTYFLSNNEFTNIPEYDTYDLFFYPLTSRFYYLKKVTEETYETDSNSKLSLETNYFHTSQKHLYLTKKELIQSGAKKEVRFIYPQDYNVTQAIESDSDDMSKALRQMNLRNIVSEPIETIALRDNKVVDGTISLYRIEHSNIVKSKDLLWFHPDPLTYNSDFDSHITKADNDGDGIFTYTFERNSNYQVGITYDDYDIYGNLLAETLNNGAKRGYSWDYNNSLLKTYEINPDGPHPIVTTYEHKPLIGVSKLIDPNGEITTFEYDHFNRLKLVLDGDGNIAERYTYNNGAASSFLQGDFTTTGLKKIGVNIEFELVNVSGNIGMSKYIWDFGDGNVMETFDGDTKIYHSYPNEGSYNVKLIIENPEYNSIREVNHSLCIYAMDMSVDVCSNIISKDLCTGDTVEGTCLVPSSPGDDIIVSANIGLGASCGGPFRFTWEYQRDGGSWIEFGEDDYQVVFTNGFIAGTYTIRCTIEDACSNSYTDNVQIEVTSTSGCGFE